MRNLKRALSLALASVMLLGMMVVGAGAASYPDVDETHNVEAIDVLNAVEVMIGRQGNFEPTEAVNRHEMAVIMAKLVLGVETADNYVGTHPFTDVVPWADKYVAACYENGLVAGTSATTFSGSKTLTAVEAAAMMLRALGYKDLSKDAKDWRAPVTAMANQIRLFNGVASIPSEELNRNQVAQLALNTLKSSVVDLKDNTINLTNEDGKVIVTGGSREYIVRSSYEPYARAINNTETAGTSASSVSGYTIELGEHLYNGKLRLTNDVDAFGRPSRVWEYDGKDIGTYVREDLLRESYTVAVKGSDVYDDLGTVSIRDSELVTWIDGVEDTNNVLIPKNNLARTYRTDLAGTGKGVLTQVFYDYEHKVITITEINTYLAEVTSDYNETADLGNLLVYGYSDLTKTRSATTSSFTGIKKDDLAGIVDTKDGDFVRVTIADNDLQTIEPADITSDQKLTSFKLNDWVNTGSQKYDFAKASYYDPTVLNQWDDVNMENTSYNLYLDEYGYLLGIDIYEGAKNYVFITGYDRNGSNIYDSTITANAIFADGTQATIKVDDGKSDPAIGGTTVGAADKWTDTGVTGVTTNKWYSYSVNSNNVYTLKLANQVWDDGSTTGHNGEINAARNGLVGDRGASVTVPAGYFRTTPAVPATNQTHSENRWVYGDTETNYIIVDPVDNIKRMGDSPYAYGISGVNTTITGVRNVDIDMFVSGGALNSANDDTYGAYAVYDSDYHIIAAVVIGRNKNADNNYVYVTKGNPNHEAIRSDSEGNWYWEFDVITKDDGLTTKTFKGAYGSMSGHQLQNSQNGLYRFTYDKDGYITAASAVATNSAYDAVWDTVPTYGVVARDPSEIVYSVDNDTLPALAWQVSAPLYANGRTLNAVVGGVMRGVHLAPEGKIYTNMNIDGGFKVQQHNNLTSAVNSLTYNDGTTNRVFAILNSYGEAEVLVIEVERNYQTNQQGNYGSNSTLTLNGMSYSGGAFSVNVTSSVAIAATGTVDVVIKSLAGARVTSVTGVTVGVAHAANSAFNVSAPYAAVSGTGDYTVTVTFKDSTGKVIATGTDNLHVS